MKISRTMWNYYCTHHDLHEQPFNIFIKEEIEKKIRELPPVYDKDAKIEIASISFAFKNG